MKHRPEVFGIRFFFLFEGSAIFLSKIAECQPLDTCFHSSVKDFAPQKRLGRTVLASRGACAVPMPGVGMWPSNFHCFQQTLSP